MTMRVFLDQPDAVGGIAVRRVRWAKTSPLALRPKIKLCSRKTGRYNGAVSFSPKPYLQTEVNVMKRKLFYSFVLMQYWYVPRFGAASREASKMYYS